MDRHLGARAGQKALVYISTETGEERSFTYCELHAEVQRAAAMMRSLGVGKGDRVIVYMPMIPEAVFTVLACARIGAIHSVVFGGFSPEALAGRIQDCDSKIVITADEGRRGGKRVPLKANVDAAARHAPSLERVVVVKATGGTPP